MERTILAFLLGVSVPRSSLVFYSFVPSSSHAHFGSSEWQSVTLGWLLHAPQQTEPDGLKQQSRAQPLWWKQSLLMETNTFLLQSPKTIIFSEQV